MVVEPSYIVCGGLIAVIGVQIIWNRMKAHRLGSAYQSITQRLTETDHHRSEAEMVSKRQFYENDLLRQFVTVPFSPSRLLSHLVEKISTPGSRALLLHGKTFDIVAQSGVAQRTFLSPDMIRHCLSANPVSDFFSLQLTDELWHGITVTNSEGEKCFAIFSALPVLSGMVEMDREIIRDVMSLAIEGVDLNRPEHDTDIEMELAREMLQIRSLTDREFDNPTEFMETFLNTMSELTGFDRCSLLVFESGRAKASMIAWGGNALGKSENRMWQAAEVQISNRHASELETHVDLTTPYMQREYIDYPFQRAFLSPLNLEGEEIGVMMLSSEKDVNLRPVEKHLIRWAADHLIETVARTMTQAMVHEESRRDELTQVANRRAFQQEFGMIVKQSQATERPCSLVLIDIDHFKKVNDTHGHPAGDAVLKRVAETVSFVVEHTRATDRPLLARYGGEEFALILPNVNETGSSRIAEAIRTAVEGLLVKFEELEIRVTISAGVAVATNDSITPDELLSQADVALYRSKKEGRNRVTLATEYAIEEQSASS